MYYSGKNNLFLLCSRQHKQVLAKRVKEIIQNISVMKRGLRKELKKVLQTVSQLEYENNVEKKHFVCPLH
jgi:hypothetical protein